MRDVVIHDVADAVDVESASGDVSGDEDVQRAVLELVDGPLALGLHHVAVDRHRRVTAGAQLLGEFLGRLLGTDEDDHPVELLDLQDAGQRVEFALVGDLQELLRDVLRRRRLRLDGHLDGIVEVLLCQAADCLGHRRREECDLLGVGGVGEYALDVLGEPHSQHLVGLIEDQELQLGDVEGALVEMVDHASGRPDDDLRAPA